MISDLKNPLITPQIIFAELTTKYGKKWIEWETLALLDEIEDDYRTIPELVKQKIRGLKVLIVSNSPWQDWDAFLYLSQVLNGGMPTFGNPLPCTAAEAAWAVTIMEDIRGEQEFHPEVRGVLASILAADGFTVTPVRLAFVQPELDLLTKNMENRDDFNKQVREKMISSIINNELPEYNDYTVNIHVLKLLKVNSYIEAMYNIEE